MINIKAIDELARRLSDLVPPGIEDARADLQKNFKSVLQAGFSRFDLVTREEFDVQRAVLLRTREKVEQMEAQLDELQARLDALSPRDTH
jgi:BMFP domain-containing protein YqiC